MANGNSSRGWRGHRRSTRNAESSSEYSSPHENDRASARQQSYPRSTDSQGEEYEEIEPSTPMDSYPNAADPDETSDDSAAVERGESTPIPSVADMKARRGKKGLTHAELALAGRRNGGGIVAAGRDDETEDEDEGVHDQTENGTNHHDGADGDDTEDDDDGENYAAALRRSQMRAASERKRSLWGQCHPVVAEAAKMLEGRGAEPHELGYAKLMGAGRVPVDYLVRKQVVVIGRSTTQADCVIKGEGRLISRRHARLYWDSDRKEWIIVCLSRKNSILVNGIPVVPGSALMPIKSRDVIEVGDAPFYFLAATAPLVRVNDIPGLEKKIMSIRAQEEQKRVESEEERQRNEARYGSLRQGRYLLPSKKLKLVQRKAQESRRRRMSLGGADRQSSSRKRSYSLAADGGSHSGKRRKRSGGRREDFADERNGRDARSDHGSDGEAENDPDMTEDDNEPQTNVRPSKDDDNLLSYGQSRRRADKEGLTGDGRHSRFDDPDDSKYREEWTKKEKTDFGRALFAVGVDPIFGKDGALDDYDWSRFRKIAELPRKSDDMLEDYYLRVMTDVNDLLEEEEREKRTKGPRTKHKAGCDCIVCENTRKSRKKKQEERDVTFADERGGGDSDGGEEQEVKSTAKTKDKLVGLVTAQKLRVRISIHEAARKVSSYAGGMVFERLSNLKDDHVKDFPSWWRAGYHDRALMNGTAIHGVGQWADIWHDPKQKPFRKIKERFGDDTEWPTNQAAMKRVRELASLINAELKREAKRAAKDDRGSWRDRKQISTAKAGPRGSLGKGGRPFNKGKKSSGRKERVHVDGRSRDQREALGSGSGGRGGGGDTTEDESASDRDVPIRQDPAQIETEDEDEVEVEVEEMEIEEEEDDQATEDDDDDAGGPASGVAAKQPAMHSARTPHQPVGDMSTDDEEDYEDNIQYETASDTE